ncbi:MAG TPA: molybdopterin-synthase adenylyltransferase MoeB [Bdellovibrionota bacterium]|nr:molybdopterin-synthase adenylyltransferase MoeB [Bdellovibrionota bacterium]
MSLSQEEVQRYSRHLIMPEVGTEGQERLKQASVLMIGAGGLGAPLGLYLTAAGIGRIGILDFDRVDASNLHRQVIYGTDDVGRSKLGAAKDRLANMNPNVVIETHETKLTSENAMEIIGRYDIVVDGTDNYPTRYLVNDACVLLKKPNVYGSIFRFEGQASVFDATRGPCYRCLYAVPPPPGLVPSCAEGGVLGILPGVIGTIQATETVKLILGRGESLIGRLLLYDALSMKFRELKLRKNLECPICSDRPTITKLIDYNEFCGIRPDPVVEEAFEITPQELKTRIDRGDKFVLLDVREANEYSICHLEGAKLIPLREVPNRLNELNLGEEIIAYCKMGKRSQTAADQLRKAGFKKVMSLKGGINAWSNEIDPSVPKY